MPTVLITGANRGLGLEFAQQYAADGWDVVAACRAPDKAEALQSLTKKNSSVRIETLEVSDHASIKALAARLQDATVDVLINNAGILSGAKNSVTATDDDVSQTFGTLNPTAWSKVFLINTIAPMLMAQEFTPHVARSPSGKIVTISSKMGSITDIANGHKGDHFAYRSSKAAVNAAMCMAEPHLRRHNITIVNFTPGWVKTDMGGSDAAITSADSVSGMRQVIAKLTLKDSGQFLGYDGTVIPW